MLSAQGSYLDSAKRLEAYPTTGRLPLEPEGIRAIVVAERDRTWPAPAASTSYRHAHMVGVSISYAPSDPSSTARDKFRGTFAKPHARVPQE